MTDQPTQPSQSLDDIVLTDAAAAKIKTLIENEQKDLAAYGLRLGIQGGGCSGFSYSMDLDTASAKDKVYTHAATAVKVIVDPRSLQYLKGSTVDYRDGLHGSGFTIKNPNSKGSCGCGQSFGV